MLRTADSKSVNIMASVFLLKFIYSLRNHTSGGFYVRHISFIIIYLLPKIAAVRIYEQWFSFYFQACLLLRSKSAGKQTLPFAYLAFSSSFFPACSENDFACRPGIFAALNRHIRRKFVIFPHRVMFPRWPYSLGHIEVMQEMWRQITSRTILLQFK